MEWIRSFLDEWVCAITRICASVFIFIIGIRILICFDTQEPMSKVTCFLLIVLAFIITFGLLYMYL